ncbi:hypothetical protein [Lacticaseibacillus paracasei]|uniref:hypothetical protein n=1 Tax=Lacticaseibacillus paracasei TaxID=1597 RepID=UPI0021C48DF2|nr:hypothetical protein [Lacticaseibacillus paracasei]
MTLTVGMSDSSFWWRGAISSFRENVSFAAHVFLWLADAVATQLAIVGKLNL